MSSTRFTPPVPTFEEIGPAGASLPDRDGFIYPDENDIAATTNKKTLRSYISNLTRGITPTSDVLPAVIEYNGPVPDHGNAYPVGDGAGFADRTFTQLGIEGGGINEMQNYSDSGRFSVNDRTLSDIVNKGELGRAHGEDALSGHLLLQGIIGSADTDSPVGARTEGAQVLIDAIPRTLDANIFNPYPTDGGDARPPRPAGLIKISGDNEILSSAPDSQSGRVGVEALSKVALDIMLKATGKPNGPDEYGGILAGLTPSGVQYGTSRVDSEALRSRTYSGVAGLSSTLDETGPVNLPTSDGIGEDRYTNKSYGVTYNPLEGFGDLTSGVTSFALLATTATAAVLAVLGIFSIKGVGDSPGSKIPTYRNISDEKRSSEELELGRFRFAEQQSDFQKALEGVGFETNIAELLNFYVPTNSYADYGSCVLIGFTSLMGASVSDDLLTRDANDQLNLSIAAVGGLLIELGKRFLVIPLTSEKGFYLNLLREIMKDSGALISNLSEINLANAVTTITQAKVIRFVDTLAKIGDLILLQRSARAEYRFNEKVDPNPYDAGFNVSDFDKAKKFAEQRIRGAQFGSKRGSALGVEDIPSAHLIPSSYEGLISKNSDDPHHKIRGFSSSHSKNRTNLRIDQTEVVRLEQLLDAEYMPFYFQDLRTNEIVSFHAFLDELSDSYSAEYNSTSGYGRIEDIKMYKSTKRSVGCTFHAIATNPKDFEYMWWQINKLTTMVYPQWSQGRTINTALENNLPFKFTQPFSQIPNATPVIRLRVGDLIRSNYSRFNLKRLFGFNDSDKGQRSSTVVVREYYLDPGTYRIPSIGGKAALFKSEREISLGNDYPSRVVSGSENNEFYFYYEVLGPSGSGGTLLVSKEQIKSRVIRDDEQTVNNFYLPENNAIVKSFESTMGMGLAAVVTQLQFTWMDGLWGAGEDGPGNRAPRSCKIQMSFEPIHDIAPGLDHEGFNRAPIYPVGGLVNSIVEGGESEPYGPGTSTRPGMPIEPARPASRQS